MEDGNFGATFKENPEAIFQCDKRCLKSLFAVFQKPKQKILKIRQHKNLKSKSEVRIRTKSMGKKRIRVSRITNEPYEEKLKKGLTKYCSIRDRTVEKFAYKRSYKPDINKLTSMDLPVDELNRRAQKLAKVSGDKLFG